ncbi:MAG: FAD/NAD(P)-binding protein [Candidatus Hadarchaeota archaeon]
MEVVEKMQHTKDTMSIAVKFVDPEERKRYSFTPGQFNMLYVYGVGEAPISISSRPDEEKIGHTIRSVGYISRAISSLKEGDIIGLRGPYGSGWPVEKTEGKDVIVIGGGIGLCPLRPAIHHMLKNRKKYSSVKVLCGARSPSDLMFPEEYDTWCELGGEVLVTVDRSDERWKGSVGLITTLLDQIKMNPASTVAMVCGPEIMMNIVSQELVKRGISADSIYLSMERRMKCGIGLCGHCQFCGYFVCKDGPVFTYKQLAGLLGVKGV